MASTLGIATGVWIGRRISERFVDDGFAGLGVDAQVLAEKIDDPQPTRDRVEVEAVAALWKEVQGADRCDDSSRQVNRVESVEAADRIEPAGVRVEVNALQRLARLQAGDWLGADESARGRAVETDKSIADRDGVNHFRFCLPRLTEQQPGEHQSRD
jgi:hypothetical protein